MYAIMLCFADGSSFEYRTSFAPDADRLLARNPAITSVTVEICG